MKDENKFVPIAWYKWVSNWDLVDIHLWVYWELPWDDIKYKTYEELAQIYRDMNRDIIIKNLWWDSKRFLHLYFEANTILNK